MHLRRERTTKYANYTKKISFVYFEHFVIRKDLFDKGLGLATFACVVLAAGIDWTPENQILCLRPVQKRESSSWMMIPMLWKSSRFYSKTPATKWKASSTPWPPSARSCATPPT